MDTLFTIIIFVAIGGGIFAYVSYLEKKRTEALAAIAASMGFSFSAKGPVGLESKVGIFKLFHKGHSHRFKNVMQQEKSELAVSHFDYTYTVGSGKSSSTYSQTVTVFEMNKLNFPDFVMTPEGFFHKVGELLGFTDINFADFPKFSKSYTLKGNDEAAIRTFFNEEILRFFENTLGFSIEAGRGSLLVYVQSKRIKPDETENALQKRIEIFKLLGKNARV